MHFNLISAAFALNACAAPVAASLTPSHGHCTLPVDGVIPLPTTIPFPNLEPTTATSMHAPVMAPTVCAPATAALSATVTAALATSAMAAPPVTATAAPPVTSTVTRMSWCTPTPGPSPEAPPLTAWLTATRSLTSGAAGAAVTNAAVTNGTEVDSPTTDPADQSILAAAAGAAGHILFRREGSTIITTITTGGVN